jgi:hypothetical protein
MSSVGILEAAATEASHSTYASIVGNSTNQETVSTTQREDLRNVERDLDRLREIELELQKLHKLARSVSIGSGFNHVAKTVWGHDVSSRNHPQE